MRRLAVGGALLVFGLQLATIRGSLGGGQDEEIVFLTAASLVRDRDTWFSQAELAEVAERSRLWQDAVRQGRDGRWHPVYGPAQAVLTVPLYWLGQLAAGDAEPVSQRATIVRWCCALNPLLTAAAAGLLTFWLAALGYPRAVGLAGGLLFALATFAWPYAKTYLSEPLSATALLAACVAVDVGRRTEQSPLTALAAGLALAAAIWTRPHNLVWAPLVVAVVAWGWRRENRVNWPAVLAAVGPVAVATAWWLWANVSRFASPLDFGYLDSIQTDFRLTNLPRGILGQLLSPGRGLIWYAPPVLLGLIGWRRLAARDRWTAWLCLGLAIWQLVFYSLRSTWWGNWCWGPRYLAPVLPLLLVIAAPAVETTAGRRWAVVLGLFGLVNAWAGLVVYNGLYQDWAFSQPDGLAKLLWSPAWSPLVGHWRFAVQGYWDLLVVQAARHDLAFGLTALVIRLLPAGVGIWLLLPREDRRD